MDARLARRARGTLAALSLMLLPIVASATPELPTTMRDTVSASSAPVPVPATTPRVLHVVGADNYPPYLFRDEDGRPAGLVADEWALWEKKTGVHVDLQPVDWADALRRVSDSRADVIDTIFWSSDRARTMDFTAPFADVR